MKILALDLGRFTGWALLSDGRLISGVQEFKADRHCGAGMEFVRFRRWLSEFNPDTDPVTELYYEEVRRHLGTDAAHTYGAFWGTLTAWCQTHEVPFEGIPVGTIKRFATGKGNADKAAMISAVRAKWGAEIGDRAISDNEADAIALLEYAKAGLVPASGGQ